MITGDHARTASAIGSQLGLINSATVLTGSELDNITDDDLLAAANEVNIFARTSPEHKLRLVKSLQSADMIVAMTGDGVNDAPALKRADIGIAMGQKGSEAAKESSDLVLADDNFASIVAAVREGRTVYDNIRKVISWTLPTSTGEALVLIFAVLAGMATMPITPIQILWINLITTVTLGLALAFEPTEDATMQRKPRQRNAPILNGALIWQIVLISSLFLAAVLAITEYAHSRHYSFELSTTLALNTLVVLEIFNLFFIRNLHGTSFTWKCARGTPVIWLILAIVTIAQFIITYFPPLQVVFGTQAVSFTDGMLVIGLGVLLFVITELEKQLRLRLMKKRGINNQSPQ